MGGSWRSVQAIAIGAGLLRLLLLWFGLERQRRRLRPLAVVNLAALVAVALYTFYCWVL